MQNPPPKLEKPGTRAAARHPDQIDPVLVEQLAQIAARLNLTEIEVNQGDLRIRVTRHCPSDRCFAFGTRSNRCGHPQ